MSKVVATFCQMESEGRWTGGMTCCGNGVRKDEEGVFADVCDMSMPRGLREEALLVNFWEGGRPCLPKDIKRS